MHRPCRRMCNRETVLQFALLLLFVALTLVTWSSLTTALVTGN